MRLVNILGASSVLHPVHGEAEAGPDGVFELPEPLAQALLTESPAHWRTEAQHISEVSRKALEELADPKKAAAVLHYVHGRVAALEGEVAALREELDGRVTSLEDAASKPPAKATKTEK